MLLYIVLLSKRNSMKAKLTFDCNNTIQTNKSGMVADPDHKLY